MLIAHRDIYCGVFDSAIARGNIHGSDLRTVECFELEIFHSSGGVSYVNGEKYPTARGMLLCAKPRQIRHSDFPVKCSFIRVFDNEYLSDPLRNILRSLPNCTYIEKDEDAEDILSLISRLGALFTSKEMNDNDTVLINTVFYNILHRMLTASEKISQSKSPQNINRIALEAYEYINENLSKDCSLNKIAEMVSVTPNYLQTVFTKAFGVSPYRYTIFKRIEKAKIMIKIGEKSMLDIALEIGFCSQSHFNRIFKEQTGKTPSQYRSDAFSNVTHFMQI